MLTRLDSMVEFLLQNGADPNIQHPIKKKTALHYAYAWKHMEYGNSNIVRLLREYGADDAISDGDGHVPRESVIRPDALRDAVIYRLESHYGQRRWDYEWYELGENHKMEYQVTYGVPYERVLELGKWRNGIFSFAMRLLTVS